MIAYLRNHKSLEIEEFPPYAPELNPVDRVWGYFKHGRLANYAPSSLPKLRTRLALEFKAVQHKRDVLAWCVREAGLSLALDLSAELAAQCPPSGDNQGSET